MNSLLGPSIEHFWKPFGIHWHTLRHIECHIHTYVQVRLYTSKISRNSDRQYFTIRHNYKTNYTLCIRPKTPFLSTFGACVQHTQRWNTFIHTHARAHKHTIQRMYTQAEESASFLIIFCFGFVGGFFLSQASENAWKVHAKLQIIVGGELHCKLLK